MSHYSIERNSFSIHRKVYKESKYLSLVYRFPEVLGNAKSKTCGKAVADY